VIFDVFNTIVLPPSEKLGTFHDGLRDCGIGLEPDPLPALQQASEGLAHREVSASRADYVRWCRATLAAVRASGAYGGFAPRIVPALEQLWQAPMRPLSGVVDLLSELRERSVTIAVCSNWSWDLSEDMAACGLGRLIDVVVPSARAGHRKPHPAIYAHVLAKAGVTAAQALFVGDSLSADVDGPRQAGIAAVHLLRSAQPSPAQWQIADIALLRGLLTP
jgi:putative hydrolase of the HAD superfamily